MQKVDLLQRVDKNTIFSISNLEPILFRTGSMYHIYGKSKAGKTVLCLWVAQNSLMKNKKVCYIDTEKKLTGMNMWLNPIKSVMKENFKLMNGEDLEDFISTGKLVQMIKREKFNVLIIDSLSQPLATKKDNAKTTKLIAEKLNKMACLYNIMIVFTTHVYYDRTGWPENIAPCGGIAMLHFSDYLIFVRKSQSKTRDMNVNWSRILNINQCYQIPVTINMENYLSFSKDNEVK